VQQHAVREVGRHVLRRRIGVVVLAEHEQIGEERLPGEAVARRHAGQLLPGAIERALREDPLQHAPRAVHALAEQFLQAVERERAADVRIGQVEQRRRGGKEHRQRGAVALRQVAGERQPCDVARRAVDVNEQGADAVHAGSITPGSAGRTRPGRRDAAASRMHD
jgi:hypothetical protein